jgi:crotonobetaine/carnitine-CoA ligase
VAAVRRALPRLEWILVFESREEPDSMATADVPGAEPFRPLLDAPEQYVTPRVDMPRDPFEIVYTSGTTGDPKGVVCSNARYVGATAMGQLVGLRPGDRPYNGLSLTHGNAQIVTLAPSLVMKLWDVCREHGCTVFNLLGGMATAIYSEPPKPNDADNPVRMVLSGGMPAALWRPFEERFNLKVLECYAAVEGGLAINPIGVGPIGSFGKPAPNLEMKIVDEQGNECPPGAIGELISRPTTGEPVEVEYFKNPEASEKKTRGGWLRSGDMCHPQVNDVFVYGVPAASGAPGERDVVAAVVPVDPRTFDPKSVFATCVEGLEGNFVPSYLQVVDEIPKTASEKPQERFLMDRFAPDGSGIHRR